MRFHLASSRCNFQINTVYVAYIREGGRKPANVNKTLIITSNLKLSMPETLIPMIAHYYTTS